MITYDGTNNLVSGAFLKCFSIVLNCQNLGLGQKRTYLIVLKFEYTQWLECRPIQPRIISE